MPEPQAEARHYPALDGLRGMAAMMIVWHHFLQLAPTHGRVLSTLTVVFEFAWSGVDLFFVLSGFLITGILADAKGRKHFFRNFYGRRVLRIFPLYYAVLVLVLIVLPAAGVNTGVSHSSEWSFWTYTSNFNFAVEGWYASYLSHVWTLAIEEQFYFVWPLVIFFVRDLERLRRALPWLCAGAFLLRVVSFALGHGFEWLTLMTFTHCDGLLLGCYLALSIRSTALGALKGLRPNKFVAIAGALFVIVIADLSSYPELMKANLLLEFCRGPIMLTVLPVLCMWLIHEATSRPSDFVYRTFSRPFVRWFGTYSYGIYILHVPLAFLLLQFYSFGSVVSNANVVSEPLLCVVYFVSCIGCAYGSWHLYERHFLSLKRYFAN